MLQHVSQERKDSCAADLAGPDRTYRNKSMCLDPGRAEACMGKSHHLGSPSLVWNFMSRQGHQETLLPCSRMTLKMAGRGEPKPDTEKCQYHKEKTKAG